MPTFLQLVDLDRFHHVTSAALLLLTAILNQSISGCAAVLKRRSLAEGVFLAAYVDKGTALLNAPMLTHRSGPPPMPQIFKALKSPAGPICLDFDQQCELEFALSIKSNRRNN